MILGGVAWHEHMCPVCGEMWACADGEKSIVERRWCDTCLTLDRNY